jgi:hypothetical protein
MKYSSTDWKKKLSGDHSQSAHDGETNYLLSLSGIKPQIIQLIT